MRPFDYVLFDLDGTIMESAPGVTKCVQHALATVAGVHEPDLNKLLTFMGPPLNTEFKRVYGFDDETIEKLVDAYRERYAKDGIFECEPYPGIVEMLKACHEAGISLGVASSKPELYVKMIMEKFGMDHYFDVICGSHMEDEKNKDTSVDNKTLVLGRALDQLEQVHHDPDYKKRCAMVGDRKFDIFGAINHAVTPVGVTFGYGSREELAEAGAKIIVDDAAALQKLLIGTAKEDK